MRQKTDYCLPGCIGVLLIPLVVRIGNAQVRSSGRQALQQCLVAEPITVTGPFAGDNGDWNFDGLDLFARHRLRRRRGQHRARRSGVVEPSLLLTWRSLVERVRPIHRVPHQHRGAICVTALHGCACLGHVLADGVHRRHSFRRTRRNGARVTQHDASEQFRVLQGEEPSHPAGVGVPHEVDPSPIETANELGEIFDVLIDAVFASIVCPCVRAAALATPSGLFVAPHVSTDLFPVVPYLVSGDSILVLSVNGLNPPPTAGLRE